MKKFLSLVLLLSATTFFYSCESEPLDGDLLGEQEIDNPTNPGNPTNPTNPTNPGTSGSYWPLALNNKWTFDNGTQVSTMKITGTQVHDGNTYFKYDNMFGSPGNFLFLMRYDNGKYRLNTRATLVSPPGSIAPYEYTTLRDDLPVGGTWTETVDQITSYTGMPVNISQVNTYEGKIVEKGISMTVNGQVYPDVLHAEIKLTSIVNGGMAMSISYTDYWFAKNVGPIKAVTIAGSGTQTTELVSYIVN